MEQINNTKCYVDYTVTDFCTEVGRPELPSPTGGAVIGVVGALLASLTVLITRVSEKHSSPPDKESWSGFAEEAWELHRKLLRFAEEDIQDTASIMSGEGPACVRKQVAAPAKIASALVKLLRLVEGVSGRVHQSVRSDVLAIAHLGRGAADAIFEIEKNDIEWGGGGDATLLARIEEWRIQAHEAAGRILHKVRENEWQK
ncbi:cyclodeaminase/cyclohydrolase family protein [Effusibacillus consociatus]